MKKSIVFVAMATILMAFTSCHKDKNGWQKFYGYTPNDIAGAYAFSNDEKAFKDLTEGEFCHLCSDAEINITATSDNTIKFEMNSEEFDYHKVYMGKAPLNSHDFMIDIKGNTQVFSSTSFLVCFLNSRVYQNADGKIRLEGDSFHNRYHIKHTVVYDNQHHPVDTLHDTTLYSSTRYYFDVIKN